MELLQSIAGDVEFWKVMAPVVTVVVGWALNERARRRAERERRILAQRTRKEESYRRLLQASKGFYEGTPDAAALKQAFLDELQLCWLHASDEVIRTAYRFLDSVRIGAQTSVDRDRAFAAFVAALRRDALTHALVAKTDLTADDVRLFRTT